MSVRKNQWDDELAFDVLQRHAAEDLHAGIYDSYIAAIRGLRKMIPRSDNESEDRVDRKLRWALRDEYPLAPVYSPKPGLGELKGMPHLSLLGLFRINPDSGEVAESSMVAVAYVDPPTSTSFQPAPTFNGAQVHQLIEHHMELMDLGLVPKESTV